MGAKRLKAIACAGQVHVRLADRRGSASCQDADRLLERVAAQSRLRRFWDQHGLGYGEYPRRISNQQLAAGVFDQIEEVNAKAVTDKVLVEGVKCFACPVSCGRKTEIREGKWAGHRGEGPEYETINVFGALCGVSDLNAITMANYRCNELGLDTISAGATIAFAMECFEKGSRQENRPGAWSSDLGTRIWWWTGGRDRVPAGRRRPAGRGDAGHVADDWARLGALRHPGERTELQPMIPRRQDLRAGLCHGQPRRGPHHRLCARPDLYRRALPDRR